MPLKFFIFRKKNSILKPNCVQLRIGTALYKDEIVLSGPYIDEYTAKVAERLYIDYLWSVEDCGAYSVESEMLLNEFRSVI